MRYLSISCIASLLLLGGCSGDLILNLSEESQRNVTVQFINNTNFRVFFTIGAFDDLDRGNPPGTAAVQQFRIEAGQSQSPVTFACFRDIAIGTQKLLDRIVQTGADDAANFDEDAFLLGAGFSSAPAGSAAEALPDAGTADGVVVRLGNNYSCDDQLLFTFEDNGDGTFRIDFEVIVAEEDDA